MRSRPDVDRQVVLKIIKHYQEEGQGSEVVQGVLLGLVVDDRLEITNRFPFPQHTEDDADFDEVSKLRSRSPAALNSRTSRLIQHCSTSLSVSQLLAKPLITQSTFISAGKPL
ncbi:eukaryotic translation initiation factor 3 subunit H-A [Tachysurus ichikawai]